MSGMTTFPAQAHTKIVASIANLPLNGSLEPAHSGIVFWKSTPDPTHPLHNMNQIPNPHTRLTPSTRSLKMKMFYPENTNKTKIAVFIIVQIAILTNMIILNIVSDTLNKGTIVQRCLLPIPIGQRRKYKINHILISIYENKLEHKVFLQMLRDPCHMGNKETILE